MIVTDVVEAIASGRVPTTPCASVTVSVLVAPLTLPDAVTLTYAVALPEPSGVTEAIGLPLASTSEIVSPDALEAETETA